MVVASQAALAACSAAPRPCPADARIDRRPGDGTIVEGPRDEIDRRLLLQPLPVNLRGELPPELSPAMRAYRVSWELTLRGGPPYTARIRDAPEGPLAEIATSYVRLSITYRQGFPDHRQLCAV